jgi:hypothetical protein
MNDPITEESSKAIGKLFEYTPKSLSTLKNGKTFAGALLDSFVLSESNLVSRIERCWESVSLTEQHLQAWVHAPSCEQHPQEPMIKDGTLNVVESWRSIGCTVEDA